LDDELARMQSITFLRENLLDPTPGPRTDVDLVDLDRTRNGVTIAMTRRHKENQD
jgi:hypothetical protein